jgi:hypothetical protein
MGLKSGRTRSSLRNVQVGTVIPDSEDLHARYDATEISATDGDTISTWSDATGNGYDLTAGTAPTYVASGINNNPVVHFDGSDDYLDVAYSALSQPNTIFAVFEYQTASGGSYLYSSETTTNRTIFYQGNDGTWTMYAGSGVDGSSYDTDQRILSALYDGANSETRLNGTQDSSGDAGTNDLNGMIVGAEAGPTNFSDVYVGEILVYPQDKSGIYADVESYLSDKWGIAV